VSELFPNVARHVDDMCILRSVVGDSVAHGGAVLQLHTGSNTFTRPSMGSWAIYGLGTENQNLPAYLTLKPGLSHGGAKNWSSGFLPAVYQRGRSGRDEHRGPERAIEHLKNKTLKAPAAIRVDMLQQMNRQSADRWNHDPEFRPAFRPSNSLPDADQPGHDISRKDATKLWPGPSETRDFAWQCLMARRLRAHVRFIQIAVRTRQRVGWDAHSELIRLHTRTALQVDQPIHGLLTDLKAHGLLKDTLVVWGGNSAARRLPREARPRPYYGYTMWMAGAGESTRGATDDYGYFAVEDHAYPTCMRPSLGMDHKRLTYATAGAISADRRIRRGGGQITA
jgi:hypothetical protein